MALGSTQPVTNECQEYFLEGKGGRCVGLITLPPSCLEIWEPQRPGTLRVCVDRRRRSTYTSPPLNACSHLATCSIRCCFHVQTLLHLKDANFRTRSPTQGRWRAKCICIPVHVPPFTSACNVKRRVCTRFPALPFCLPK